MAESIAHDVVNEAQSVGGHHQPSDDLASTSNPVSAGNGQAANEDDLPSNNDGASESKAKRDAGDVEDSAVIDVAAEGQESAQAIADASGGSDTDNAADAGKDDDGKGHLRTGSVKKPVSFKPVSVTKSFLAKGATASPVPSLVSKGAASSPSPASLLSLKPRLVAKSALGGAGTGLTKMDGTSGPDASKVWNKNRPVPQAPPRQFTDEELQTRYGIHMTARLQADDPSKNDSKWADIDDDEDDWAPETVEWMDGTKSNVGQEPEKLSAAQKLHPNDRVPSPALSTDKPAEAVKPVPTAIQQKPSMNLSTGTKTILRPGAALNASPRPGLGQKAGSNQNALGTTKVAATPAKSPWAVLPPVEKAAPINPPVQQPRRPFQSDPQGFDALPPAPSPAQEMAADDFSRSMGGDRGTQRELFNAHSGRYEPAGEARRGSRHEHNLRQPALLQRPSHGEPAGPSSAFQTHRQSNDGPGAPWAARRRASSSLSGIGARRPSLSLSQDHSQGPHNDVAVESPRLGFSSLERSGRPPAPSEPPVPEVEAPPVPPQEPEEDPVVKQQRLMKEKIEHARAMKQKTLEAEEAEKVARLKRLELKMKQLEAASAPPPPPEPTAKATEEIVPSSQPPKTNAPSPPKPPVPTSEGEIAQYGMMKVHQPHPVKRNFSSEASLTSKSNESLSGEQGQGFKGPVSPNKGITRPSPSQPGQHPASGERAPPKGLPNAPSAPAAPLEKLGPQWTAKSTPSPNDYNWNPNTMAARSAVGTSVWGPPLINEKSLGNGTFESKFSHPNFNSRLDNRFDNSRAPPQGPMTGVHGPIGSGLKGTSTPPSTSSQRHSNFATTFQNLTGDKLVQQELPSSSIALPKPSLSPSIVDDQAFAEAHLDSSLQQSIAQSSSLQPQIQTASPLANSAYNSSTMSAAQVSLPPTPSVMGNSSYENANTLTTHGRSREWLNRGPTNKAGWNNFHATEQREMKVAINQYQNDLQAPKASGVTSYEVLRVVNSQIHRLKVTVHPDGSKAYHKLGSFDKTLPNMAQVKESEVMHPEDHTASAKSTPNGALIPPPAPVATSSRFFGAKSQTSFIAPVVPTLSVQIVNDENEAPPPAEQGLFEDTASQPAKVKFPIVAKVNLPGMKVQLPPRSPVLDRTFNANNQAAASRVKPGLMHADDLKAKFGHLHLTGSVFASTRPTFDVTSANARSTHVQQAHVSPTTATSRLPLFSNDTSEDATSKPMAEDECIDFPDFGSKPAVRVPSVPHKNHHLGYSEHSEMLAAPSTRPNSRFHQKVAVEVLSVPRPEILLFLPFGGFKRVDIKLPGQKEAKSVDLQHKHSSGRESVNGAVASPGNFRGGYAPRGARGGRGRGGFENKFGGAGSNHVHAGLSNFRAGANHAGNAGPSNFRGGANSNQNHNGSAAPSNFRGGANNYAGNAPASSVRGGASSNQNHTGNAAPSNIRGTASTPRGPSHQSSGTSTPKPRAQPQPQSQFASKNEYAALAQVPQGVSNW